MCAVAVLALGYHLAFRHVGLSLWDEGFFWYGAQRVAIGEVPLRDFQSYDPGRYYLPAAMMRGLGSSGIVAARIGNAVILALVTVMLMRVVARAGRELGAGEASIVGIAFVAWMIPDFKAADFLACAIMLAAAARLSEKSSFARIFAIGCAVGFAAWIGRNHGVYGALGSIAVMLFARHRRADWPGDGRAASSFTAGVFIGYLPMLISLVLAPGQPDELVAGIGRIISSGSTNIALPLPRPWWVRVGGRPWMYPASDGLVACAFFAIPIVIAGLCWVPWRQRHHTQWRSPVVFAVVLMSIPYAHYAYSRPDAPHLAVGTLPVLVAAFMALQSLPAWQRRLSTAGLASICVTTMAPYQRPFQAGPWRSMVATVLNGDTLRVSQGTRDEISLLQTLSTRYTPRGESFVATPFWPGAYAVLERKAPSWEIYSLFPRSVEFQQRELHRWEQAAPAFAVLVDVKLDGRPEYLFRATHPLMMHKLEADFVQLRWSAPQGVVVFVKHR
jgi:hypothetical protein